MGKFAEDITMNKFNEMGESTTPATVHRYQWTVAWFMTTIARAEHGEQALALGGCTLLLADDRVDATLDSVLLPCFYVFTLINTW